MGLSESTVMRIRKHSKEHFHDQQRMPDKYLPNCNFVGPAVLTVLVMKALSHRGQLTCNGLCGVKSQKIVLVIYLYVLQHKLPCQWLGVRK
jgi:hypothetical protein